MHYFAKNNEIHVHDSEKNPYLRYAHELNHRSVDNSGEIISQWSVPFDNRENAYASLLAVIGNEIDENEMLTIKWDVGQANIEYPDGRIYYLWVGSI